MSRYVNLCFIIFLLVQHVYCYTLPQNVRIGRSPLGNVCSNTVAIVGAPLTKVLCVLCKGFDPTCFPGFVTTTSPANATIVSPAPSSTASIAPASGSNTVSPIPTEEETPAEEA